MLSRHRLLPIAVLALLAISTAAVGQIILVDNPHPGAGGAPIVPPRNLGPGPPQYCTQCQIPRGYSQTPADSDELCVNKRVACMCASPGNAPVKSDQPLCLYKVTPPAPGQPQNPHTPMVPVGH
jgi:hypothetical protein